MPTQNTVKVVNGRAIVMCKFFFLVRKTSVINNLKKETEKSKKGTRSIVILHVVRKRTIMKMTIVTVRLSGIHGTPGGKGQNF